MSLHDLSEIIFKISVVLFMICTLRFMWLSLRWREMMWDRSCDHRDLIFELKGWEKNDHS